MNNQGLTSADVWAFNQLLVKANREQLTALQNALQLEANRRTVRVIA